MIRQKHAHTLSDNTKSNTLINSVCIGNFSRLSLGYQLVGMVVMNYHDEKMSSHQVTTHALTKCTYLPYYLCHVRPVWYVYVKQYA